RRIGAPVLIAALTTVLGFLSIGVNRIPSIREMGIYSAIGITIAFVLSIVMVPALLAVLPVPTGRREAEFSPALGSALRRVGALAIRHRRAAITIGAVISLLSILPIPHIRVDSNFQSFFRENDPIRVATDAINRNLVGTSAFYVAIDSPERDIVKKWDTLRRIKDLQLYIDSVPGIDKTISFVDYCEALDRGAQEVGGQDILIGPGGEILESAPAQEKTTFWENPAQLGAVIQLISSNPKNFSSVVNPEFSRTNILVRTSLTRSSDISAAVEKIQAYADGHFPPELQVHPTGNLILLTQTTGNIVAGQIQSLALTAGIIFVIMAAMFLSIRVGIIAMVPNVFPILVFLGLMGLTGADLNLATNMIASIALGIAVDDTIHIMSRLSSEVRTTGDQEKALLDTLSTVGKPALYASLLLFLGFLTLCFSSFVPIQQFGYLSAATMVFGIAGELLLTPAFLSTTRIITLWDLLYLKLGKDPHKTIGIFENLRPWQAKIVALMGELRSFPNGQAIIREGDVGDAMYVIIDGRAEVRVDSGGQSRRVRELGRGDVFGEMGLIRRHRRSADVIAAGDVEVMAMDRRFLSRVQRRYPRIASKIFLNIARILSDRLQQETQR
ncbi:MAG TPA: cyclic nucleotide-binding domain-containing protein, partial [Thermoanaerobaculia bacterium]